MSRPHRLAFAPNCENSKGCGARTVQIWAEGELLREHPRHTAERVLIDPSCYEGEATEQVLPPPPLGRMGKRLQEILRDAGGAAAARSLRRPGGGGPMSAPAKARVDVDRTRAAGSS